MILDILKIATVTPKLHIAKPLDNEKEIINLLNEIKADIVVFPELSLTGYTAGDYFFETKVLEDSLIALKGIISLNYPGIVIVGLPISLDGTIFNVAAVINQGKLIGLVPKSYLSSSELYNETRYFSSGLNINFNNVTIFAEEVPFGNILLEDLQTKITFGIEIGNDMYVPITRGAVMSTHGANMIINLAASNDFVGKNIERLNIVKEHSRKNVGAYVYASSGITESSSYAVFGGHNIVSVCGEVINEKRFKDLNSQIMYTDIDFGKIKVARLKDENVKKSIYTINEKFKRVQVYFPSTIKGGFSNPLCKWPLLFGDTEEVFNEIRDLQHFALVKRLDVLRNPKVILGVSGGLDSSFALTVLVDSFKRANKNLKDIIAVSLPGHHTTKESVQYANDLATQFGVTFMEINISDEVNTHFKMINHNKDEKDITYENIQARIRTQTLMNLANKYNGIVIGTNNLSEIALGFMTYNADMMSMYAINSGLPKTLLHNQFKRYKAIFPEQEDLMKNISNRPYSPELKDNQDTEDALGSYQINDFLIYRKMVFGDSPEKMVFIIKETFDLSDEEATKYVSRFVKLFSTSQFKRQVVPDGPQIIVFSLSSKTGFLAGGDV